MSVDTSAGDSTPMLANASLIEATIAINKLFKYVEVSDVATTPLIFNKQARFTGHVEIYNTASDYRGLEIYKTDATKIAGVRFAEAANLTYVESLSGIPLYLNANGASNRMSLRINDAEVVQVTSLGVGFGIAPQESFSISSYQASRDIAVGIYAPNASNVMSVSKLTQSYASGNLTLTYGAAGAGTTNNFVLTSRSGVSSTFTSAGDLGINTPGPIYSAYGGARYLAVKGSTSLGAIELSSGAADAAGLVTASIFSTDVNTTSADKRQAVLEFGTDGITANNRGGFVRILVKKDAASGPVEAWRVHNTGQMSLGVNAPYADEMLRIYKGTGAKLLLSDANNVITLASVPVSTASEFSVGVNGGEALRVDMNRRLGINTSTPAAKLDIGGAVTAALAQAVFARGADVNYTLGVRNGSNVNASGEVLFSLGTEYTSQGTAITGGFKFLRGGNAQNVTMDVYADSLKVFNFSGSYTTAYNWLLSASSMGRISTQTNTTTAGVIVQPSASGVDGTDGAFITFRNKGGTKAFSLGMDFDGEFRVGGGSIANGAYKVLHEGYNPGAMNKRGTVNWTDVDLYRQTGTYVLRNPSNSASYGLIEFSDIGSSTTRIQLIGWYGGGPNGSGNWYDNPDELYFRTARDTQTNWDGMPALNNRIWHSGNLLNPVTKQTDYQTPNGTYLKAVGVPTNQGETFWSTPAYGTNQGDNRTHFGYLYDVGNNIWHNYIRGNRTISEGLFATGPYPFIPGRAARYLATYAGTNSEYGITLNNLVDTGTAISFCTAATQSAQGTTQGSVTTTANAVQFNTTSDKRLKENIKLSGSALEHLMDIDVVEFDFKNSGDHVEFGFLAQQLALHAPCAVKKGNEGEIESPDDVWQVDNSKLVPMLLKSQQQMLLQLAEAMKQIGTLTEEIQKLKKQRF